MTLLLLEALGAGLILIGIIWWTMFSGRKHGEIVAADPAPDAPQPASTATTEDKKSPIAPVK
jgi:hypothetical protein